jgi:hypothetical protein
MALKKDRPSLLRALSAETESTRLPSLQHGNWDSEVCASLLSCCITELYRIVRRWRKRPERRLGKSGHLLRDICFEGHDLGSATPQPVSRFGQDIFGQDT